MIVKYHPDRAVGLTLAESVSRPFQTQRFDLICKHRACFDPTAAGWLSLNLNGCTKQVEHEAIYKLLGNMKTEWCVCRPTHSSVCRRRSPPAPCTYTNCALTFAWPSDARPRLQGSEWLPFIRRRRRRWLVIGGRLPRGRCAMAWCKRCIWLLNGFLSHRESSRTHTSSQSLPALGARAGEALPAVGSGAVGH